MAFAGRYEEVLAWEAEACSDSPVGVACCASWLPSVSRAEAPPSPGLLTQRLLLSACRAGAQMRTLNAVGLPCLQPLLAASSPFSNTLTVTLSLSLQVVHCTKVESSPEACNLASSMLRQQQQTPGRALPAPSESLAEEGLLLRWGCGVTGAGCAGGAVCGAARQQWPIGTPPVPASPPSRSAAPPAPPAYRPTGISMLHKDLCPLQAWRCGLSLAHSMVPGADLASQSGMA